MENNQTEPTPKGQIEELKDAAVDKIEGLAATAGEKIKEATGVDVKAKAEELASEASTKLEELVNQSIYANIRFIGLVFSGNSLCI